MCWNTGCFWKLFYSGKIRQLYRLELYTLWACAYSDSDYEKRPLFLFHMTFEFELPILRTPNTCPKSLLLHLEHKLSSRFLVSQKFKSPTLLDIWDLNFFYLSIFVLELYPELKHQPNETIYNVNWKCIRTFYAKYWSPCPIDHNITIFPHCFFFLKGISDL